MHSENDGNGNDKENNDSGGEGGCKLDLIWLL